MTLLFGYKASAEQFAPLDLLRFGVEAEQAGFDSVFVSDHFQPWRHDGGHAPAALPWLGALGVATERVIIGTSVLTPTFRYHPAVIAQAFATLGCLFPGRVILGVGTGESMNEVPLGIDWPAPPERFARLKEAVLLTQRLWAEDRVTVDGQFYSTHNATIYDKPEVPVPIYIGAAGPAAAKLAGRIADGLITTSGKPRELYTETLVPATREGLEIANRPESLFSRTIEVKVSFDPDVSKARDDTKHWAALALSQDEKMGVEDPIQMQELADALPVDRAVSRWIVSDDPDEHVARIREYVSMGFDHLVFHGPGIDQSGFIARYGREILPRLREGA